MTHRILCSAPRHLFSVVLLGGVLAGQIAPETHAAPPVPVPPLLTSSIRFADKGNGIITDSLTSLVWLKDANCFGLQTWWAAQSAANELASGSCGLSDGSIAGQWRLPNINELESLVDYTQRDPALPASHPFTDVQTSSYWSSTAYISPNEARTVNLSSGTHGSYSRDYFTNYVWPVRGGQ